MVTAKDNWQQLFQDYKMEARGEVYYLQMPTNNRHIEYYIYEIRDGLLMFFSSSKREDYDATLKPFIKQAHGMTNMWFPLKSFKSTIDFIISRYSADIYSFKAHRPLLSKYPSKIRKDVSRSIRYLGSDADQSLSEFGEIYGVLPTTVDFKIKSAKIRITNNGFILIRNISLTILRIVEEIIDQAIVEPIRLRNISK